MIGTLTKLKKELFKQQDAKAELWSKLVSDNVASNGKKQPQMAELEAAGQAFKLSGPELLEAFEADAKALAEIVIEGRRIEVVRKESAKTDFEKLKEKVKEAKAMARELENQQNHILGLYQTVSFAEANLERMKEKSPRLFPEFIPAEDHEETKPNPWDEKTNTRWEE